jgi:hypothetical protein
MRTVKPAPPAGRQTGGPAPTRARHLVPSSRALVSERRRDRATGHGGLTVGGRRLDAETSANYSFNFSHVNTCVPASGCSDCDDASCQRCTGTVTATYTSNPTITLPTVPDDLTPCQQERVRDAIDNQLAPHEEEHATAFRTYNGTSSRSFDITGCAGTLDDAVEAMANAEEAPRRAAATALSDALDPFFINIDLDCEDEAPPEVTPNSPPVREEAPPAQ